MGVIRAAVAVLALAAAVATSAAGATRVGPLEQSARYLASRQLPSGAFAEPGGQPAPELTAWAVLGLRASGAAVSSSAREYLAHQEPRDIAAVALVALARAAIGDDVSPLVARLRASAHANGAIGATLNSTIWATLALRQAEAPVPTATKRLLLRRQSRSGGWGWATGVAADSNDTAAAVQALRALGVGGRSISRALAYLRRHQNDDGGFELSAGRASDTQSTAWAIQAYAAARAPVPRRALAFLARMRRADGSYRYSTPYPNATPVWVTAQALPAVVRKPFPLR